MSIHALIYPLNIFLSLVFGLLWVPQASGQAATEQFDGSFRLQSGEVITGGYMVENAQSLFLYMDTERLDRVGLFERISDTLLRSIEPWEAVEIEFIPDADGQYNTLIWREQGRQPIRGERVYPHSSRAIEFVSGDGTQLQGRLLLPDCPGPHPVVVVVGGSGPVNRYVGTFTTYFLKYGVAVLAYDKRGYTTNEDAWREPDLVDLSADAAAAVRFAATQPELDGDRLGLFGSSQGGWVAPPAAVAASETDFLIVRSGAALTSAKTVLHEIRQELRAEGLAGLDLDYAMDLTRELYALAISGARLSAADTLVAPYLDKPWYRAAFGEGPISELWSTERWEWSRRNHAVTPIPSLERFAGPVLWFLAELDENVPLVPTRAALERAFSAAPGDDHEIAVINDAPHSFLIPSADGPPRFAGGFWGRMEEWMVDRDFTETTCWDK